MSRPLPRKVADLPPLPDWPPLPEEKMRIGWPPPSADAPAPVETTGPEGEQRPARAETAESGHPLSPSQLDTNILGRWRRASRRMRVGIASAIVISLLIIAACSSLALHAISAVGNSASTAPLSASNTQQTSGIGSASTTGPTTTASPNTTATTTATSSATLPLTLTFTCASGSVRGTGKICVHTVPSATLNLSVRYCDGTSAKGLHSAGIADASGNYTWSWPVHMTCVGAATATVTATRNGVTVTAKNTFNITG